MRAGKSFCGLIRSVLNLIWNHFCDQLGERNNSPKDTFNEFLQFISQTIRDDIYVSDLYITLYRIGDDPAIFNILTKAVEHGVQVHANIELCASGEFINQFWLVKLRNAGVDVHAYQCGHLKVHAKLALIKYKHGRMICHICTGN